jgi:hypothetical protein
MIETGYWPQPADPFRKEQVICGAAASDAVGRSKKRRRAEEICNSTGVPKTMRFGAFLESRERGSRLVMLYLGMSSLQVGQPESSSLRQHKLTWLQCGRYYRPLEYLLALFRLGRHAKVYQDYMRV